MQSFDSSRQEADFIINDTLLKLKGSSNNSNSLRQATQLQAVPQQQQQQQLHSYPTLQQQQQTQTASQQTHHNLLHHPSPSLSLSNLSQIHHQPPPYIFDDDEPSGFSSLPTNINDHELLASVGAVSDTHTQMSVLTDTFSIISPGPVLPDMILSASSTSPIQNCSKPEKQLLHSECNPSSSFYNSSPPNKKVQLASTSLYGSPPLLQSFGSSSSVAPCSSISTSTAESHLVQQINPNIISTTDVDLFKSSPGVGYPMSTTPMANITTITSTPQAVPSTPTLHSSIPTGVGGATPSGFSATTPSGSSAVTNTTFFDIHDKIRELYLYLLINDEKALKESRRRHRTRSFVLERLVEREKLNTIVLNLHPGNKGYSLAFYQNDKHNDILNEPQGNASSTSYEGTSGTSTQADRGGGPGGGGGGGGGSSSLQLNTSSSGHKVGTNASSSRLKQTQISSSSLNSNNSNNLLISSNNLDVDEIDGAEGDSALAAAVDSFGDAIDSLSLAVQASNTASIDDNLLNTSSATADSEDIDEDANLVEIMRWDYEADDLLNSIDKEELPLLFSDLLETRTPNVFYSGCVICQIRDFRQTFPISSNSCDIYHVLLKPTNDTLYSDVNQLSIDSDISAEDKLMLESQLILATSEPLCLDPDPKIGRFAINSQHVRQIWNTPTLRRQMKKYSQISINRKRKIDQFTHNYGLELCDYLQRVRQRSMISCSSTTPFASGVSTSSSINSNSSSGSTIVAPFAAHKLPKKPIRTPNLDFPPLTIPEEVNVEEYAKAHKRPELLVDCMPQLIEEYTLETDREAGRIYHIKLSIFQRPSNSEYLGELYVDRDYREGERNGEACQFSLGTRFHANRYIEQFKEIFTEEDRKAVTITYRVPGKNAIVSYTTGMAERRKQQEQQQQAALAAALQQQQQQVQQHSTQTLIAAAPQQQRQIHIQPAQQIITPALNATNVSALPGNQLNINLQGANIVGIATAGNVQQLRQQPQQIFEATGTVSVQAQPPQQLSLSNGSLVLVQQQAPGTAVQSGITIQNANQQKTQLLTSTGQLTATNAIRTHLGSSVPILQAQLKTTPLVTGQQQQKTPIQSNPTLNALVTNLMSTTNQFPPQQPVAVQQQATQKTSNNAAILSLLNSAPAAMTNTSVVNNTFTPSGSQQQQAIVHQQSTHQADTLIQQQPQQRKNEPMQSMLTNNLRKINMVSGGNGGGATLGLTSGGRGGTNLIAVSAVGLNPDNTSAQNVRVTMSALASQLASPPAVMTNNNFAYTATNNNNNNSISLNNNIKIVNNTQRVITANTLRRDSTATVAAPSPGSDSNASNTSATSNLGFTMPGLSALLATSPSPNSDQSQTPHGTPGGGVGIGNVTSTLSNQTLIERLSSGTNVSTSPGLSPQQQSNVAKSIVQHVANVQSPAASISPLSSPPPQPSPQQPVQQAAQTTTLNLQGINLTSLQGAMATFPGLQNVQVQIPCMGQPISLSLSSAGLAAAVQQQQQQTAAAGQQGNAQQTTSLLVSVPVTSTTQVNTMQTVPGAGNRGTVVSVPATVAATQTVVLTNAATAGNSSSGSMLSLPIAQFVTSGVKGLNAQTIRTAATGSSNSQNVVNANIIQTAGGGATLTSSAGNAIAGTVNVSNTAGSQPIQLLNTIQQRSRSIQLVGAKQLANRGQLNPQRNATSTIKIAAPITAPSQITTTANITASPLMTQKLQLKLHKQAVAAAAQQHQVQQQQQQQIQQVQQQGTLQSQQQTQQQQHIQMSGAAAQQRLIAAGAISVATPNQKRRRSATEINK